MSTEVPKALFDFAIRSQISTGRYASKVVRDILGLLNDADKDVLAKIASKADGTFTKQRLDALLREIRATCSEIYGTMGADLKQQMLDFAEVQASATAAVIATRLPVTYNIIQATAEQLKAIVDTAPIRVGTEGALLLEELFVKEVINKEQAIMGALRLGQIQGETIEQMVRRLTGTKSNQYKDGLLEISRRSAEGIVRSVVISTSNKAAMMTYSNNSDVVKGWVYVGTLDSRMCEKCSKHYGKRFNLGEGPQPILHIRCRCFSVPEIKTWRELGFDLDEMPEGMKSSSGGLVKADMTYPEWLKSQDKATQIEILGPSRQKLFASGKIEFNDFTDNKGIFYTLDELKKKHS